MGWVNSGMSLADVEAEIAALARGSKTCNYRVAAVHPLRLGHYGCDTTVADTTQTVTSNITGATTPANTFTNILGTVQNLSNEEGVPVGDTGLTTTQAA